MVNAFMESIMHIFNVSGIGCGNCVGKITKVIQELDESAMVTVDRAQGRVEVVSVESEENICQRIIDIGFPAVPGS